jgi:hypothetical protein
VLQLDSPCAALNVCKHPHEFHLDYIQEAMKSIHAFGMAITVVSRPHGTDCTSNIVISLSKSGVCTVSPNPPSLVSRGGTGRWPPHPILLGRKCQLLYMPLCFWTTKTAVVALDLCTRAGRSIFTPYLHPHKAVSANQHIYYSYICN